METVTSQDHEDELELGLGLSLGSGSGGGGGGGGVKILTAQDLPSVMTGNHSGGCRLSGGGANISGNKRAAADSPGSPPPVSQVVGWPPIRTYRMNNLANQTTKTEEGKKILGNENSCSSHQNNNNNKTNNDANKKPNNGGLDKSKAPPPMRETGQIGFVKVNMDGVQIGRKIDLNAHACYDTLAQTIEEMFFKPNSCTSIGSTRGDVQQQQPPPPTKRSSSKLLEGSSEFVLVYEDKEGDWMLVGDVPWGMFLSTVKRLRIMRTCEANGLGACHHRYRSCSKISRKKFGETKIQTYIDFVEQKLRRVPTLFSKDTNKGNTDCSKQNKNIKGRSRENKKLNRFLAERSLWILA